MVIQKQRNIREGICESIEILEISFVEECEEMEENLEK